MLDPRSLSLGRDPLAVRQRLEALEHLLESAFAIPATNKRIGLDVVLDFVPVVGTITGAALGSYFVWEARNLGMSKWSMARMGGNVGTDFLLGLIPWIGAVPDYFFKSNSRNLRIIKRHLDMHHPETAIIDVKPTR